MTIELIDTEIEEGEESGGSPGTGVSPSGPIPPNSTIPPAVTEVERWSEYVEKYVSSVTPQVCFLGGQVAIKNVCSLGTHFNFRLIYENQNC